MLLRILYCIGNAVGLHMDVGNVRGEKVEIKR